MRLTLSELSLLTVFFLGLSSSNVHGLKIPFTIHPRALRSTSGFRSTSKLTYAFGANAPAETVDNKMNIRYTTNITINGKEAIVALDTGSTDLWVDPPGGVGQFNDTSIPIQLNYGDGSYGVSGTVGVGPFKFSSYEVLRQAFLHVTNSTVTGLEKLGISGILGLSFDFGTASRINAAVKSRYGNSSTWGQSVVHNIFDQHPDQPNFIALSLSRTEDLEDTKGGSFTIGEYNSNYTAVSKEPQLPQFPEGGTRWTTLLEGVLVGGQSVPVTSTIKNVPAGRGVTLLDTGDPDAMFPTTVWDGIYSGIPGAVKYGDSSGPTWIVPCNTTTIVEFVFGGKKYPIHPLDLTTISDPFFVDGRSAVACVSAFRVSDSYAVQGFEYSFGTSFLRNVYSAYHFGDTTSNGKPYMQLLSRIDTQKAVSQVATIRGKTMASLPPEIPPATLVKLLPSGTGGDPPSATGKPAVHAASDFGDGALNNGSIDGETVKKYGLIALILLAANVAIGLVLLVLAVLNRVRTGSDKRRGRLLMAGTASTHYTAVGLGDDVYHTNQKRYDE